MMNYDETAKQQAFQSQLRQGMVGSTATEAGSTEMSPFVLANLTLSEAQEICRRVGQLADRMCGSVPTPVSGAKVTGDTPFVLPALRHLSAETLEMLRDAGQALSRIERSLP